MSAKGPTEELVAYSNEDAVALFPEFHAAPERSQLAPLRLPLCLPQSTAGSNAAFTRAYSPELQASGIEMGDWLQFIDGLNIAMSASPPLRVVELAGMIIGFVPYHWAMIAGASMQFAAEAGIRIIAKTLTDRFLRRANAEYFAPRGMRVRICKTAAMRQIIGRDAIPDPAASASTSAKVTKFAKSAGRVAESVVLHLPIASKVYNTIAPKAPTVRAGELGGMTARRLAELEGYALPLSFDIPPPTPEEGIMNKASGLSVRLQTWRASQAEAKVERNRQLLAIQEGRAVSLTPRPAPSPTSSSQNALTQAWDWVQIQRDRIDEYRAGWRGDRGLVDRKLQSSVEVADRKEWNSTDKLLWVVLLDAEQDAQIYGRELVDNDAEVEEILEEDWQTEMKFENTEDKLMAENEAKNKSYDDELDIDVLEKLVAILRAPTTEDTGKGYSARLSKGLGLDVSSAESVRSAIRWLEGARAALDGVSNYIAEEVSSLQRISFRNTGILDLPEEVLLSIMKISICADWPPYHFERHWNGAIPLSHVCRRFRYVSLDSTSLWTFLSPMSSITETRMFLERSEGQQLKVHLCDRYKLDWEYLSPKAFLSAVVGYRHMWKSLCIDIRAQFPQDVDVLRRFLSEMLSLSGHQTFPALEILELQSCHRWVDDPEILDDLDEFREDYERLVHFFDEWKCPRLEAVFLENFLPRQASIFTRPLRALELTHYGPRQEIVDLDDKCLKDILRLQPNLERLEIQLDRVELLRSEFSSPIELGRLSTLKLRFCLDKFGLKALRMTIASLVAPNVSRLDLIIYVGYGDLTLVQKWIRVAIPDVEKWPKVETVNVEIVYDAGPACGFERILELPNLAHLSIACDSPPEEFAQLWYLLESEPSRSLRSLRLKGLEGFCRSDLVDLLQAHELRKLEVIKCPSFSLADVEGLLPRAKIVWIDKFDPVVDADLW